MKSKFTKILNQISKSELLKNISVLATGTLLAQFIPIALQPFLRRQFSPEGYGAYSVYCSLVGILVVIASFKYELAIILPKKKKEAANILFLSLFINIFFTLLLLCITIIWKRQITEFLNLSHKYANYIYFVPLGTFLYNFYQSINYWLIREKRFLAISKNKISRRATEGVVQTGFSFIKNSFGLIFGDILGHITNVISGIFQSSKTGLSLKLFSFTKLIYVTKKYSEYPKLNLIPSLMSASSYLLPIILVNKFFSTEDTGYFDLSKMVLSIPLALIATSVSNVLLQKIAEKFKNNESFLRDLLPIAILLIFVAILEIVVIRFFGEELFSFFFGKRNVFSGKISEILVWSYALNFINASFSSVFIAMKKIKILSIWQIFYFFSILSLFLFKDLQFFDFLEVYVIIEIASYFIASLLMIYLVLQYEKKIKQMTT